jgi:hypothetical protein
MRTIIDSRIALLGIYLYVMLVQGPWVAYRLWRRSHRRAQRFRALYGRGHFLDELDAMNQIIDTQLWYERVLHREPSEEELDQIIWQAMCEHGHVSSPSEA